MVDEADIIRLNLQDDAEAEACDWVARLDRGKLTAEEKLELVDWLRQDRLHEQLIREIATEWYDLDPLAGAAATDERAVLRSPWRQAFSTLSLSFKRLGWAARKPLFGSVLFILALTVSILGYQGLMRPGSQGGYYETRVGEVRTIELPDGSIAQLNTDSIIEIEYVRDVRGVHLLRGEGVFSVAPDAARPFVVQAAGGLIRAVGTKFSVRLMPEDALVSVVEGSVELIQRIDGRTENETAVDRVSDRAPSVILSEGEAASVSSVVEGETRQMSVAALSQSLSWTRGELDFQNESLEFVVAEVSRYTPVDIVIADPDLKELEITGVLKIGEVEVMLEGISASLGLTVTRVSDSLILISRS